MKYILFILAIIFASCSTPKTYYDKCSCFNCTDHKSGIIPVITLKEFEYNINNYITDLPEELHESGDYIALKSFTDTTLSVIHFHSKYGRKYYKGWYIYQLR